MGPLFESLPSSKQQPLPHALRPQKIEDFVGAKRLLERYPFLQHKHIPSFIVWGPPGTGKTTLAKVLAKKDGDGKEGVSFFSFSAVMGNLSDLRKVMGEAQECSQSIVFIDEIHRFSKAQQDALLPRVEAGHFTLIGATTENPKYVVNSALLSRCHIVELQKLGSEDLFQILQRALSSLNYPCPTPIQEELLNYADGDARRLLNVFEALMNSYPLPRGMIPSEDMPRIKQLIIDNCRDYDRDHNRHYDVISAFIKSMRGSDPDAALFWLAVMIDGGEDPVFIARRMIIFASEDVGNADPWALLLATSTLEAVKNIGLPEARINLGQAASYLASTVKSNAAYNGINEALEFVKNLPTPKVPDHIRTHSKSYKYPHSFPEHFVKQAYHESKLPRFYRPTEQGREKMLKERLDKLWN